MIFMKKIYVLVKAALSASLGRFFYTRPALKRGGLVLAILVVPTLAGYLVDISILSVAAIWAPIVAALFLGMGAERAAIDWDPVFSLPPVSAFAFWRWHALEKKRFLAALSAVVVGVAGAAVLSVFQ